MLVLTRKRDEKVMIGDNIVVTVVEIRGDKVRLGFEAPAEIRVDREEVYEAIRREHELAQGERSKGPFRAANGEGAD